MINRKIKFRCWDKQNNAMFYTLYVRGFNILEQHESMQIMQYTGLIDINGVEICEGDICIRPYLNNEKSIGVIEYKNGAFVFVSKEDPTIQVAGWSLLQPEKTEVVGNIYENNELIKNKIK